MILLLYRLSLRNHICRFLVSCPPSSLSSSTHSNRISTLLNLEEKGIDSLFLFLFFQWYHGLRLSRGTFLSLNAGLAGRSLFILLYILLNTLGFFFYINLSLAV